MTVFNNIQAVYFKEASGTLINSTIFRPRKEDAWIYILFSLRFLHQFTSLFPFQPFNHSGHSNSSIDNLANSFSSETKRTRTDHKNERIWKSLDHRQNHHLCGFYPWFQYGWNCSRFNLLTIAQSDFECRNVSVVIFYNIETSVPKSVYRHKSNLSDTNFNKKVSFRSVFIIW